MSNKLLGSTWLFEKVKEEIISCKNGGYVISGSVWNAINEHHQEEIKRIAFKENIIIDIRED